MYESPSHPTASPPPAPQRPSTSTRPRSPTAVQRRRSPPRAPDRGCRSGCPPSAMPRPAPTAESPLPPNYFSSLGRMGFAQAGSPGMRFGAKCRKFFFGGEMLLDGPIFRGSLWCGLPWSQLWALSRVSLFAIHRILVLGLGYYGIRATGQGSGVAV